MLVIESPRNKASDTPGTSKTKVGGKDDNDNDNDDDDDDDGEEDQDEDDTGE